MMRMRLDVRELPTADMAITSTNVRFRRLKRESRLCRDRISETLQSIRANPRAASEPWLRGSAMRSTRL